MIGRGSREVLVTTIHQVEQDGGGDDGAGDGLGAVAESDAAGRQGRGDAACGIEPEDRAAGQHDGVGLVDIGNRIERISLAGAGRTAALLDGGDRRLGRHHHGDAGDNAAILGIADGEAGNVGDEVQGSRTGKGQRLDPSDDPV